MPRGGARNRSGPRPDPSSARSERRSFKLTALPSSGFDGEVPEFPLPPASVEELNEREQQIWAEAWRTPQACAWSMEPWRWPVIAEYARFKAHVESSANAALIGQLHRFRDQIGLTPAGMRENGWAIATDQVSEKREQQQPSAPPTRRLRAVSGEQ